MRRGVQRKDTLNSHVDSGNLEFLEKDLQHFAFVLGWVHVGFGEEDGTLIGCDLEKREGMFPKKLHVVPVLDNAVREGVLKFVETAFVAGEFVSDIGLQLVGCVGDHHLIFGSSHADSLTFYIEGNTKGRFSSPLNPTFMRPLP
jgi:hypothetical protein